MLQILTREKKNKMKPYSLLYFWPKIKGFGIQSVSHWKLRGEKEKKRIVYGQELMLALLTEWYNVNALKILKKKKKKKSIVRN